MITTRYVTIVERRGTGPYGIKMKIYLASNYRSHPYMREVRSILANWGHSMRTEKEIREQLKLARSGNSGDSSYDGAIETALGWVVGDIETKPYVEGDSE